MHNYTFASICGDIAAALAVIGSLVGYIPDIASGMAVIYYLFQFYRWLRNRPQHRPDDAD